MAINKKYSYNGYDPNSPESIARKVELQAFIDAANATFAAGRESAERDFQRGILTEKQYTAVVGILVANNSKARTEFNKGLIDLKLPFKGKTFVDVDPAEFSDSEIVGTSFYQDGKPGTKVFPAGVKNLLLTGCDLNNVDTSDPEITVGAHCCNHQVAIQNNLEFYKLDKDGNPVSPLDEAAFDKCSLSKNPADIPVEKLAEPITITNDPDVIMQKKLDLLKMNDTELKAIIEAKEAAPIEEIKVVK